MDDPWANAWGDPSTTTAPPTQSTSAQNPSVSSSTWSAPSVSAIHGDNEDDLSMPSWTADPVWEPSTETKQSLWSSENTLDSWGSLNPTYGGISFSKSTEEVLETSFAKPVDVSPAPTTPEPESPASRHPTPPPVFPPREVPSQPPLRVPTPTLALPPPPLTIPSAELKEDGDGFGTFESGDDEAEPDEQWTTEPTYVLPSAELNAWGDAASPTTPPAGLGPTSADPKESSKALDDAWSRAIEARERQDRHVPPEVFAAILQDLQSLSEDMWPVGDSLPSGGGLQALDAYRLKVEGLAARLIPEGMTLPSSVPFPKTFASRKMTESLKLTKNAPITRSSPMAMYLASKGSLAWEATVKSQPNVVSDDVAPLGWKIVEQNKEPGSPVVDSKKKAGSLFSFFTRKAAEAPARAASPVSGASVTKSDTTPRASIDSAKPTHSRQASASGRSTPSVATPANPLSTLDTKHTARGSVTSLDGFASTSNPPSAVSRFFNRFSRGPSQTGKEPMALSSDDLEFLSDTTASATTTKPINPGFDAFDVFLSPPPTSDEPSVPPLLPPPLPPPPKPASRPMPLPSSQAPAQAKDNDPFSLFTTPLAPVPATQVPVMPPAVPAKGPAHSLVSSRPSSRPASRPTSPPQEVDPWGAFDFSPPSSPPSNKPSSSSGSRPPSVPPASIVNPLPPPPKPSTSFASFKPVVAVPTLAPPPASSRSQTPKLTPLQPSSRSQTPQMPTLLPPPGSRSHTPNPLAQPPTAPKPSSLKNDDDDFADFLSSPPPGPVQPLDSFGFGPFGTTQPTTSFPASVQPKKTTTTTFDDFDDFLHGPGDIPPALPAKPTPPPTHAASSKSPPPAPSAMHTQKVSKADHSRTLSLLETAAARGNWLAPPSPLPDALQPPPNASHNSYSNGHAKPFGSSTMQAAQAQMLGNATSRPGSSAPNGSNPPSRSSSPWSFPPPPGQKAPISNLIDGFDTSAITAPMKLPPPPTMGAFAMQQQQKPMGLHSIAETPLIPSTQKPVASTGAGGLSAQDLSFFEGL